MCEAADAPAELRHDAEPAAASREVSRDAWATSQAEAAGPWTQPHPEFIERLRGQLILAPLTKYGNLPFRRLCADFGADVSMGEMMFARQLIKRNRQEKARLRQAHNERCFGE